jgi:AcrR family transcriptional regulator
VTLDDVLARTRTSKSQVFHYFPGGREDLLLAVAQHEADRVISDQQPHLENLGTWEDWQRWRSAVIARYRKQGQACPLHALTSHLGSGTPGAQAVVRQLMLDWERPLRDGIVALQQHGEADPGIDPEAYAGAIVASIQGGVQILMATGSTAHLEHTLDLILAALRGRPPYEATAEGAGTVRTDASAR